MIRGTLNALLACVVTFVVCAVAYPVAVYALGHTLFPRQAEGSLIVVDGKVVGSSLIAQPFASDRYFAPRPSAAGASGYAADAASGSNLGTNNPALRDRIAIDASRWIARKTGDASLKAKLATLDAASSAEAIADVLSRSAALGKTESDRVPTDLVTTSGAGLDPHIRPESAFYQIDRVAAARGVPVEAVRKIVEAHIDRSGALIGAPARVNVLQLNLDLDRM